MRFIPRSRTAYLVAGAGFGAIVFWLAQAIFDSNRVAFLAVVVAAGLAMAYIAHAVNADLAAAAAELERRGAQAARIRELSAGYSGALGPGEIGTAFLQRVRRLIPAAVTGTLVEYDDGAATFRVIAEDGPATSRLSQEAEIAVLPESMRVRLIREHRNFTMSDTAADPAWAGVVERFPAMASVGWFTAIPLVSRSRLVGALFLHAERPDAFDGNELELLPVLGQYVAGALHNALSLAEAEARADREALVNRINQRFRASLDAEEVIGITSEEAGHALSAARVLVCAGDTPDTLEIVHQWQADPTGAPVAGPAAWLPLASHAAREARTVTGGDASGGLATPIRLGQQVFGVLLFQTEGSARAWTGSEISLVETVASELRVALETARLFQARQHEAERLLALYRAASLVASSTDPRDVLTEVLQSATTLLGRGEAAVYLWDEGAGVLRLAEHVNAAPGTARVVQVGEGVGGRAFASQQPIVMNDYQGLPNPAAANVNAGWHAALSVPLGRAGRKIGVLTVGATDSSARFDGEDARLLALFGEQAVAALTTAELVSQQQLAVAELERLNAAKSDFVSIVSHEFRTPLTGIQGFSELLRDDDLTTDQVREYAATINREARRLARMTDEMLDLDRLESGRISLALASIDLNVIITTVGAGFSATSPLHRIDLQLQPDLGPVAGDPDRLTQVMVNLFSNAVKYSPEGGVITVTTRADEGNAEVSVRDEGIGIPAAGLETVFERYTRLTSEATRFIQGTGLGLPIIRQIVTLHGGRVWAESVVGAGSTFRFTIPLAVRSEV